MSQVPGGYQGFFAVPCGIEAVAGAICFASNATSGRQKNRTEHARLTRNYGLTTLVRLLWQGDAADQKKLAASILATKRNGCDLVSLSKSIVKKAQWIKSESDVEMRSSRDGVAAILFLNCAFFSVDPLDTGSMGGAIGRACSCDEGLMKAYVRSLTNTAAGYSRLRPVTFESFSNLSTSFLFKGFDRTQNQPALKPMQVRIVEVWLRAGVFSELTTAAAKSTDDERMRAVRAVYDVVEVACVVKVQGDAEKSNREYQLGNAALQQLLDAGATKLLESFDPIELLHENPSFRPVLSRNLALMRFSDLAKELADFSVDVMQVALNRDTVIDEGSKFTYRPPSIGV